ncbi:MAG: lipid II flippase MurJ [Planctomycetota bacterium]
MAVSFCSVLQIINQFLFFAVNARTWGADADTDPLLFAVALPVVFSTIITGSLSYVLVPHLVKKLEEDQEDQAPERSSGVWELASYVGLLTLMASSLVAACIYFFALPLAESLMEQKVPGQHQDAAGFLRILTLQVVLYGMISWAQAVLHSQHRFLSAAVAGVLGTAVQLLIVFAIGHRGLTVIAWAINAGSALSLAMHLLPLVTKLRMPKADSSAVLKLFASLWPLILGAMFLRLDPLVDRVFASELDSGSLTHISWAHRIHAALLALGTSSLALVAFPQLAEFYAKQGISGFQAHFALCTRRLCLLIVPVACGVSCFALWIIRDLLEGGEFLPSDTHRVGWLVTYFMGLFVGASLAELVSRGFYVLGDTKTPTVVGVICLVLGLALKYYLFQVYGLWGIGMGISFYYLFTAAVLAVLLARRAGHEIFSDLPRYFLHSMFGSLIACGCCALIYAITIGDVALKHTWIAAPVGMIVYFAVLLVIRNSEAWQLLRAVALRFGRKESA